MSLSNNINTYDDIRETLDQALESNGATLRFEDPSKAHRWRHRANKFRRLNHERMKKTTNIPGNVPSSPYDGMVLKIKGSDLIIELGRPVEFKFIPNEAPKPEPLPTGVLPTVDIGLD